MVVCCVKKTGVPADLNDVTLCFLNLCIWTKKVPRAEVYPAVCEMTALNLSRNLENFLLLKMTVLRHFGKGGILAEQLL